LLGGIHPQINFDVKGQKVLCLDVCDFGVHVKITRL